MENLNSTSHIRLSIYKSNNSTLIPLLIAAIGANNDKESPLLFNQYDIVALIKGQKAQYPNSYENTTYEVVENKVLISFDGGATFTISLDWVLLHELDVNEIAGDDLAPQVKERVWNNIITQMEGDYNVEVAKQIIEQGNGKKQGE